MLVFSRIHGIFHHNIKAVEKWKIKLRAKFTLHHRNNMQISTHLKSNPPSKWTGIEKMRRVLQQQQAKSFRLNRAKTSSRKLFFGGKLFRAEKWAGTTLRHFSVFGRVNLIQMVFFGYIRRCGDAFSIHLLLLFMQAAHQKSPVHTGFGFCSDRRQISLNIMNVNRYHRLHPHHRRSYEQLGKEEMKIFPFVL